MHGYFCAICPTSKPCKCFTSTCDAAASARTAPRRLGPPYSSGLWHRVQGTVNIPTHNLMTCFHHAAIFLLFFFFIYNTFSSAENKILKAKPLLFHLCVVCSLLDRWTKLQHQDGSDPSHRAGTKESTKRKNGQPKSSWPSYLTLWPVPAAQLGSCLQPHSRAPCTARAHVLREPPHPALALLLFPLELPKYTCKAVCFLPAPSSEAQLATGGDWLGKSQQWKNTGPQRQSTHWSTEKPFFSTLQRA